MYMNDIGTIVRGILWALGVLWSWYNMSENNKWFKMRAGEEHTVLGCNCAFWFISVIYCLVKCVRCFV